MVGDRLRALRRWLRNPRTIVAEVAAIAVAGLVGTLLPQRSSDPERWLAWQTERPGPASWLARLALDRIHESPWFLGLVLLAGASLAIVVVEGWRRAVREWRPLPATAFAAAPYRVEFQRPARGAARETVRASGRAGRLGSPLLHLGLLVVVIAGVLRLLFSSLAQVELYVGEALGTRPQDWGRQWAGWLASPVTLPEPVTFAGYGIETLDSGRPAMLSAELDLGSGGGRRRAAINAPASMGPVSLYVDSHHGPAALVLVESNGERAGRAILLRDDGAAETGLEVLPGALQLRVRAASHAPGALPASIEVRALAREALLGVADLAVGQRVEFPGNLAVSLVDLRWWARFTGSRDSSVPLAFLGIGVALAGVVLLFSFVRTDALVRVTPGGSPETESVTVALRPQRFSPLFRERFEALVRSEGGPVAAAARRDEAGGLDASQARARP